MTNETPVNERLEELLARVEKGEGVRFSLGANEYLELARLVREMQKKVL